MANYTLNQGETFRVTIELQDSNGSPIRLAERLSGALSLGTNAGNTTIVSITDGGDNFATTGTLVFADGSTFAYTSRTGNNFFNTTAQPVTANAAGTIVLAQNQVIATVFFAGVANLGVTEVPIQFKMQSIETVTYGRGAIRAVDTGVFKIYAFIAADDTAVMEAGDWAYEIRQSDKINPVDDTIDSVSTVLEGTITIKDGPLETGPTFNYSAPENP